MNKGKQWKWSKATRKILESRHEKPLEINTIKAVTDENPEKYIMPIKMISKKEARRLYPKKPKRLRGISLNWPKEVKEK